MFRRPKLPPPPPTPLGIDDLEAAPRSPLITRRHLLVAAALVVGGIAWGAAVRFADSLSVDMGFLAFALKVGVGVAFLLALLLILLFRGFEVDRVAIIAALAIGGAWVGLNVGPTVAAPVTVAGTFTFTPTVPAGTPPSAGDLDCEWAAGRWKIGALRTPPLEGFDPPHVLTVDFLRRTISLADDDGSTLLAVGNGAFTPPPDAPPAGEGDASGTLDLLLLQVDVDSTPADPNEVQARFTWDCPAAPEG
jgi:hypothetical protein